MYFLITSEVHTCSLEYCEWWSSPFSLKRFQEMTVFWSAALCSCVQRERESKGQGGTSRQETEERGMQTYCCDAAVRGNGRESLFLNSLCVAGSLWRVALVDKVSRVKCHKPTRKLCQSGREWEEGLSVCALNTPFTVILSNSFDTNPHGVAL